MTECAKSVYTAAYGLYETGSYEKAADLFLQLTLESPYNEKYWRGLASCRQMETKYVDALHAWSVCALLDEKDPMPHFHAAECLVTLGEKEDALKALNVAESLAPDTVLLDKIKLLKEICTVHHGASK